jgi:hypothetical protein
VEGIFEVIAATAEKEASVMRIYNRALGKADHVASIQRTPAVGMQEPNSLPNGDDVHKASSHALQFLVSVERGILLAALKTPS